MVEEIMESGYIVLDCTLAQRFREKFSSDDFRDALIRLALFSMGTKPTDEDEERVKNTVISGLQTVRIVGVDNVTTYLVHNGNRIPSSESRKSYHMYRETAQSEFTIFFRTDQNMSPTFSEKLAEVVNCVVGGSHLGLYLLKMIIDCETGMENQYLDEKEIPPYGTLQSNTAAAAAESFVPTPGTFVPLIHHCLLRQDFQRLNPGDFVAMETDDPAEQGEPGPPTYVLVKIVAIEDDGDDVPTAALRYRVLVAPKQEIVVSALVLYAFVRDNDEVEQPRGTPALAETAMEPRVPDNQAGTSTEPQAPPDLGTIRSDLRKQLKAAGSMSVGDRKKLVKRLLLRWHPDKNPDSVDLATKVTQYILNLLERLESGLPIYDDEGEENGHGHGHGANTNHPWWSFYEHMNRRASHHRQHRRNHQHQQHFAGSTSYHRRRPGRWGGGPGFFTHFNVYPNPQPGEARRWLRQAKADKEAAVNDEGRGSCCAFEWACYKYYEASAKALRAAHFARDAGRSFQSLDDVRTLAAGLGDDGTLTEWAAELHQLLERCGGVRYPSGHQNMRIPRDIITRDTAVDAARLCSNVVDWCTDFINRN